MTATAHTGNEDLRPADLVNVTIDGTTIAVPAGTLLIRAAELIGIEIPRFCDHPLLEPVGACRQCLVEVVGQRKPVASCTVPVTEGMVAHTQNSSVVADKAQQGVMELLLINHPLDCPVCDKGGECPLQNQAMSNGRPETRFDGTKRTFAKPIPLSSAVLLDRERCVLCARCTRFSQQIAGDPFIELMERGALQQVGTASAEPLDSYFSGNTVQICPVGALTGTSYRFRARPFDLVSSPNICEHCASGCAQRTDHRRGTVLRRLAGDDPQVNEEWNCDKGRWAFAYSTERNRLDTPMLRGTNDQLVACSWSEAFTAAARGLRTAAGSAGVLTGGRLTIEDAYAYSKFARVVLGTNDIDFRARAHSTEEADFLGAAVAGHAMTVDYQTLESAPAVLLAGFEPEEESPIIYLRLRKAARARGMPIYSLAPYASRGVERMSATLIPTVPGAEPHVLDAIRTGNPETGWATVESDDAPAAEQLDEISRLLREPGAVILVGERLAGCPGALSAAIRLADYTGTVLAWVPRRAGERGALEAGALPNLLPGGRPVVDPQARRQVCDVWNAAELPSAPGRDTTAILDAASNQGALVVAGVETDDLPDPQRALAALDAAAFVIAIEQRHSTVTERADVVFPVATAMEKSGTYLTWEGRARPFEAALPDATVRRTTKPLTDQRVLHSIATEMGVRLEIPDLIAARREIDRLGSWDGTRARTPAHPPNPVVTPRRGTAVLASWRMLLDLGRMQDGAPDLAGTARTAVLRLSAPTAAEIGASDGAPVTVVTDNGNLTLPLLVTAMPDRVVWLPLNSPHSSLYSALRAAPGSIVGLRRADEDGGTPQ